ncbi:hypothetical protein [Halorubrum tropicale]|uniref:DUF8115 domain-containing protein n=1 Tax=Halorubrum tropicale TaxID=1765655 RepID=A0A0N0BP47_9EURY|nr:hypothetical protein [Halorubrum tropicale]KOX93246.1 hypothetical protein AMR74_16520 [Halorubrum tropicale]
MTSVDDGFEDDLLDAVTERNESGAQRSVSIWDGDIAALLDALEENPDRAEQLVERASDEFDISIDDDVDRSEIVRVLIISGLAAVDPEVKDSWRDAIGKHASQI